MFQDFLYLLGTPNLTRTSEWLLRDCILQLHLYSNFKVYSLITVVIFNFDLSLFIKSAVKIFRVFFFMEHSINSNFKMHSVIISAFLFVGALRKKQWHFFFRGASCTEHFQKVYCPDSSWVTFNLKKAVMLLVL